MKMTDEATPAGQRFESKLDLALKQFEEITQGVVIIIAERDAALAKVEYLRLCYADSFKEREALQQKVSDLRKALEWFQVNGAGHSIKSTGEVVEHVWDRVKSMDKLVRLHAERALAATEAEND